MGELFAIVRVDHAPYRGLMVRISSPAKSVIAVIACALIGALADAASPKLPASSSWLGNSFPGAQKWVQQDIASMCVDADGTVYTNVEWDEGGREVGV